MSQRDYGIDVKVDQNPENKQITVNVIFEGNHAYSSFEAKEDEKEASHAQSMANLAGLLRDGCPTPLRGDQVVALVHEVEGEVELLLVAELDGDPAVAADVGGDLDAGVLDEGGLLFERALDGDRGIGAAACAEHFAAWRHLEGELIPRMVLVSAGLGQAVLAKLRQPRLVDEDQHGPIVAPVPNQWVQRLPKPLADVHGTREV